MTAMPPCSPGAPRGASRSRAGPLPHTGEIGGRRRDPVEAAPCAAPGMNAARPAVRMPAAVRWSRPPWRSRRPLDAALAARLLGDVPCVPAALRGRRTRRGPAAAGRGPPGRAGGRIPRSGPPAAQDGTVRIAAAAWRGTPRTPRPHRAPRTVRNASCTAPINSGSMLDQHRSRGRGGAAPRSSGGPAPSPDARRPRRPRWPTGSRSARRRRTRQSPVPGPGPEVRRGPGRGSGTRSGARSGVGRGRSGGGAGVPVR